MLYPLCFWHYEPWPCGGEKSGVIHMKQWSQTYCHLLEVAKHTKIWNLPGAGSPQNYQYLWKRVWASIDLQNCGTTSWQPSWILQTFSTYCTPISAFAGKERERNVPLPQRRVLMQQEFKGTIQWPDNSPLINCPSLWEGYLGLAATSDAKAASVFAGAIAGGFRCAQCYDCIKWAE